MSEAWTESDSETFGRRLPIARWNHHALEDPDPIDKPDPLLDQMHWLAKAGLERIDVHCSKGGMSLFSGVKPAA